MNLMTYKNYSAKVEYDPIDKIFVGHLIGIEDIVGFHGASVTELEAAFHEAVDHYLDVCEKLGKSPQKAYSGKLTLRMSPQLHQAIATAAKVEDKSLNQWAVEKFGEVVRQ